MRSALRQLIQRAGPPLGVILVSAVVLLALPALGFAAPAPTSTDAASTSDTSSLIQLAIFLGGLSLLPFAVMTLTSFLRIVIVLSFLRSGLGAQNVPPNIVIIAISLFLSLFVMGPTIDEINKIAFQPLKAGTIEFDEAMSRAQAPLKGFMLDQLGANSRKEVRTFYELAEKGQGAKDLPTEAELKEKGPEALPMRVIIPAFLISELKKAFIMGFCVLLPFLVIDMVISNILLSLGMFMLPPVVISLPFKILLFVLAGGWTRVVELLIKGFNY